MDYSNREILPAILATTDQEYKNSIAMINTFTNKVHLDIVDGKFASNKTIGLEQVWWPKGWQVDVHMMVEDPSQYLERLILIKPRMVLFHAELKVDLRPIFNRLQLAGIKVGLVLLPSTVPNSVRQLIEQVDHVLIFAGRLGQMGGKTNLLQTGKVRLIKNINPEVTIGWDGGANINNLYSIVRAGVDIINVGGAISKAYNPAEAYQSMVDLITSGEIL